MDISLYNGAVSDLIDRFGDVYGPSGFSRYEWEKEDIMAGFKQEWKGSLNGDLELLVEGCEKSFDKFVASVSGCVSPLARTWGRPEGEMLRQVVERAVIHASVPKVISEFSSSGKTEVVVCGGNEEYRAHFCDALIKETGGRYFVRGFGSVDDAKSWVSDAYFVSLDV